MSANESQSHPEGGSPRNKQQPTFNGSTNESLSEDSNLAKSGKGKAKFSIVNTISSLFCYRKTSLTLFIFLTLVATWLAFWFDTSLELSIDLPTDKLELEVLESAWLDLQNIGRYEHPYASKGNDYVHDYIYAKLKKTIKKGGKKYIELDDDENNNILYSNAKETVTYYESNNVLVRINGTNLKLPALLVSAHYDSVPTSFGITDDGMGIASMLGLVEYYALVKQPARTIIFNFNNDEEFGLYGATSFVLSHPWFKQVSYFLNLEGTGAGGKCVLFRGTDYGITKYFKNVRYPFGTSLFQQGFNNRLIHSETDYKIYKEDGKLRGIDLAFYKPRDLYHTSGDNIKNINIKSLWHMLSNSIDFVGVISAGKLDIDSEKTSSSLDLDFPSFGSLFNYFLVFPISALIIVNIVLLVAIPVIGIPLSLIVFYYKRTWSIGFINFIKFPLSFVLSILGLRIFVNFISSINEFLPNSNYSLIVTTSFAFFALLNYLILNLYNLVFYYCKIHDHDEKLILILQISVVYYAGLIYSTIKLASNKIGDDHTGEYPLTGLYLLQSLGGLIGIVGYLLKKSKKNSKKYSYEFIHEDEQPLIGSSSSQLQNSNYGSNELAQQQPQSDVPAPSSSSSFLLTSSILDQDEETIKKNKYKKLKTYSYGWSLQFLIVVPLSSFIIYNSGTLILDGLNKSIQESLNSENLIYEFIQVFVIAWILPFLAFIFKINRFGAIVVALFIVQGLASIYFTAPFDQLNPLKLRFIQSIDLDKSDTSSSIEVRGRIGTSFDSILKDLPSVKESGENVICTSIGDGMESCAFNSTLSPKLATNIKSFNEYLDVKILKNSLNENVPFGLLSGEIEIKAPKNRLCNLYFHIEDSEGKPSTVAPVKTVIIYDDNLSNSTSVFEREQQQHLDIAGIPKGFSRDEDGNYIYKDLDGIKTLILNKLDWEKPYHVGFQWVPNFESEDVDSLKIKKLGVDLKCFWGDLDQFTDKDGTIEDSIPSYGEFLHYSPNYVSWSNSDKGLVSVSKSVFI